MRVQKEPGNLFRDASAVSLAPTYRPPKAPLGPHTGIDWPGGIIGSILLLDCTSQPNASYEEARPKLANRSILQIELTAIEHRSL